MNRVDLIIYASRTWDNPYFHIGGRDYNTVDTLGRRIGDILGEFYRGSPLSPSIWLFRDFV